MIDSIAAAIEPMTTLQQDKGPSGGEDALFAELLGMLAAGQSLAGTMPRVVDTAAVRAEVKGQAGLQVMASGGIALREIRPEGKAGVAEAAPEKAGAASIAAAVPGSETAPAEVGKRQDVMAGALAAERLEKRASAALYPKYQPDATVSVPTGTQASEPAKRAVTASAATAAEATPLPRETTAPGMAAVKPARESVPALAAPVEPAVAAEPETPIKLPVAAEPEALTVSARGGTGETPRAPAAEIPKAAAPLAAPIEISTAPKVGGDWAGVAVTAAAPPAPKRATTAAATATLPPVAVAFAPQEAAVQAPRVTGEASVSRAKPEPIAVACEPATDPVKAPPAAASQRREDERRALPGAARETAALEAATAQGYAPPPREEASAATLPARISREIARAAAGAERHEAGEKVQTLHLALDPPGMGAVHVRVENRGESVRASVTVAENLGAQPLGQLENQVRVALSEHGLSLDQFQLSYGQGQSQQRDTAPEARQFVATRPQAKTAQKAAARPVTRGRLDLVA